MNDIPDSVVERVRKLLRLASSNNEHEMKLALAHCQRIALEHNLDLSTIQAWETKKSEEKIEKQDSGLNIGKRKPICNKFIVWLLQSHYQVRCIYSGSRYRGQSITFIGTVPSIQNAIYLYEYLNRTFMELWHEYRQKNNSPISVRESYHYGLYQGVNDKLNESKKEVEQEKFESFKQGIALEQVEQKIKEIKNQYSLMVISQKERLEKAQDEFYPHLRTVPHRVNNRNYNVMSHGKEHGRNISLNKALNSSGTGQLKS